MSQIVNSMSSTSWTADEDPAAVEQRIFRSMCVAVAVAVAASAVLWSWRITIGLALGGALSLVNHHWLRTAIAAAFGASVAGARPKIRIARYVLRYFIVGAIIAAAYSLNVVSLPATLLGLSSFAAALLFEGFMQIYFAIVNRGEN
jgi:hypothetical protein